MNPFPKEIYLPAFQDAIARAKQNLEGEDLKKCLKALKNFMRNYVIPAEKDYNVKFALEFAEKISEEYGDVLIKLGDS